MPTGDDFSIKILRVPANNPIASFSCQDLIGKYFLLTPAKNVLISDKMSGIPRAGRGAVLSIEVKDAVIVTINVKMLNIHNSHEIQQQLNDIARIHQKNIIVNLEHVTSLDSSTISMLVDFNSHLKESGRELTFVNPSPFVKKIFDMIHISKFFTIK